jgi:predicted transposase/invertase (TIGR01784 family)
MPIRLKHDALFRKAMENPIVAKEFFDSHLPQNVKSLIDLSTLRLEKESFIEKKLKNSISDVLFSVKFDDTQGYLYLLLEHQRKSDHFMAFRLFKYMMNICDRHLILNKGTKSLPLIYPLIFFNGKESYTAPLNFWQLFTNPKFAKEIWTNDYQLINVHNFPDEELKKRAWSGILQFFMKHIDERNLLSKWQEIADLLPQLVKVEIGFDYIESILYYTLPQINKDDKIHLQKLLTKALDEEKGEKFMTSLAKHWHDEGLHEGIEKGIEKGVEKTAINMLKENLDVKLISQVTGLSLLEINKLKAKL